MRTASNRSRSEDPEGRPGSWLPRPRPRGRRTGTAAAAAVPAALGAPAAAAAAGASAAVAGGCPRRRSSPPPAPPLTRRRPDRNPRQTGPARGSIHGSMDWVEQIDRFGGEFLAESRGTEEEERDIFSWFFPLFFSPSSRSLSRLEAKG